MSCKIGVSIIYKKANLKLLNATILGTELTSESDFIKINDAF
jgi:hypothetical protein